MRSNGKATHPTRRQVLASGAGAAGSSTFACMPALRAAAAPEPGAGRIRLTAGNRILDVNGKPAPVFGLFSPNGKPGVTRPSGAGRGLKHRPRHAGRHTPHHPRARPVAALDAGRLSLAANAADPGGRN